MIKIIAIVLSSFFSISLNAQDATDCRKFHTGFFIYPDVPDSKVVIIRTSKKQIEISESTGTKVVLKIQWISDCEAYITYRKVISHNKKIKKFRGMLMKFKIVSIEGDTYYFSAIPPSGKLIEGKHMKVN